jgi:hypothetical protein
LGYGQGGEGSIPSNDIDVHDYNLIKHLYLYICRQIKLINLTISYIKICGGGSYVLRLLEYIYIYIYNEGSITCLSRLIHE